MSIPPLPKRRWGISAILMSGAALVITVPMAVATLLDIDRQRALFHRSAEENGALLANTLARMSAEPLDSRDLDKLTELATVAWDQQDVSSVRVLGSDGRVLVGPGRRERLAGVYQESALRAVQDQRTVVRFESDRVEVANAVTLGARIVGAVQITLSIARLEDEIRELALQRVWQTAVLLLFGIAVAFWLAQSFVRPVRRLVEATGKLTSGDLATRVGEREAGEFGQLARSFNSMADELQNQVRALQESRARVGTVQEGVRREVASHLHGRVQGKLLALRGRLFEVVRDPSGGPERVQALRDIAEEMGRVTEEEISVLSRRLYPAILRRGLVPAVQSLVDQFELAVAIETDLDEGLVSQERANPNAIPEGVRLAAYRIVEEALGNALKHAQANSVIVRTHLDGGAGLRVSVCDNGHGFDSDRVRAGLGLAVMQDYAAAVGGTCAVSSSPGTTEVTALLPLQVPDEPRVGPAGVPG